MTGFMDGMLYDDELYFNGELGYVLKYSLSTFQASLVARLTENLDVITRRWIQVGEDVYLISNNGYQIINCIYDNKTLVLREKYLQDCVGNVRIKEAFLINRQIWCIPTKTSQKILIFDVNSKKIKFTESISELLHREKISLDAEDIMTIKCVSDKLFFTLDTGKELICYAVNKKMAEKYYISDNVIVSGFEMEGEDIWFRAKYGIALYRWNREHGITSVIKLPEQTELEKSECNAKLICLSNGRKILLPTISNTIAYYDGKENCLKRINGKNQFSHRKGFEKGTFSIGNIECNGKLWLFPWASETLVEIDVETMNAKCHFIELGVKEQKKIDYLRWNMKQVHYESKTEPLEMLLEIITQE